MKTNENQKSTCEYKVYIHRLKTWVDVTEEQYYAFYRDIWATRKRAQAHGQCMCPKSKTWMCDGDCLACEFRAAGDNLSLDYTVEDGEGNQKSWADDLPDDTPNAQSIMEDLRPVSEVAGTRPRRSPYLRTDYGRKIRKGHCFRSGRFPQHLHLPQRQAAPRSP